MGAEASDGSAWPVPAREVLAMASYSAVFGVSFGVVAIAEGFGAGEVILMSAVVNAGASQFGAVSVLADGGSVLAAVAAGVLLNLRYLAISLGSAPAFKGGRLGRALRMQLANDGSYALGVTVGTPTAPDGRTIGVAGAAMWLAWVSGTAVGALLGPVLGDPATIGADVALPAGFVALLVPMLRDRAAARAAAGGVAVALLLAPLVPLGVAIAAAALVGLVLA